MDNLIDSHCHLDKAIRKGTLKETLERAQEAGVSKIIAVGTDPEDWGLYENLAQQHRGQIYHSVGLHPCYVEEDWKDAVTQIAPFFAQETQPVAIGEIGLDYHWLPEDKEEAEKIIQRRKDAFWAQLELALQLDTPVIIHSRNAFSDCVEMIDRSGVNWERVVFHCFSEGAKEIGILNERGGRASFTGNVTFSKSEAIREACKQQGIERLMIETDAPYQTPVPHRGETNEPAYVRFIAQTCAQVLCTSMSEVAKRSFENTKNFFRLQ